MLKTPCKFYYSSWMGGFLKIYISNAWLGVFLSLQPGRKTVGCKVNVNIGPTEYKEPVKRELASKLLLIAILRDITLIFSRAAARIGMVNIGWKINLVKGCRLLFLFVVSAATERVFWAIDSLRKNNTCLATYVGGCSTCVWWMFWMRAFSCHWFSLRKNCIF